MAFFSYSNSKIKGVTCCVPPYISRTDDYEYFNSKEAFKFSSSTGVIQRFLVKSSGITSADLCFSAAEKLIDGLKIEKDTIDGLIFVSQTRDYILPSTSCILQERLGLSYECYSVDIPYGCSGYLYGLQTACSLLENGDIKRVLLLAGDVVTLHHNVEDKSSYPLFGDAGTATLIDYQEFTSASLNFRENINDKIKSYFHFGTDGSGYKAIIIPDGGYRNRVSLRSFEIKDFGLEGKRTNLDCSLAGMDVFSFGISKPPKSIKSLVDKYNINIESADFFIMHQANKFLNEKIRKKLKIKEEKTPYSLENYGNTSCASIPLTMCSELSEELRNKKLRLLLSAFGVGLSWGSAWIETDHIYCKTPYIYDL